MFDRSLFDRIMFNRSRVNRLCGLVVLLGLATAAWSDTMTGVSSQASQGSNDSVQWSQLGADGTVLASSASATSAGGVAVNVGLTGPNSLASAVCAASPTCSWAGTGFAAGDRVIWTSDASAGGNGPVTLRFGTSVSGAGALIQADEPGQFVAEIQAFNGVTLLGSFTVTSNTNGDAVYVGILDQTGANITSVTFSLTACGSADTNCVLSDFAVDTVFLNVPTGSFGLSVTLAGTGAGSVSSSPAGITCPSTCSANFTSGTMVTLTATAAAGSTFAGWSGACSGTGTCSVTMTAAKAVTATFNSVTFPLTVTEAGTGSGSVGSSPAGITCPSTCSANFASGTVVTLTPTASAGSTFAGWSGACSGTGTCSVTMTAAKAVTATFNLVTFALTVTEAGTGGGSVSSSPAGITCPSTCGANFTSGTVVTLTATAAAGSTFAGWSGACSGTGTCSVTMTAAKAVTATFNSSSSPAVTLTPTSLNFGDVATGVTSAVKSVTLKNSGKATLTITAITITGTNSGDFPETSTCTGSLAAGKTCLIKVQFKPSATGARSAAVSITDNAAGNPQQVPLSGTGTTAKLSPTPLAFGTLAVGLTSAVKKVTLTNVGTTALTISSIAVTGAEAADFPETATTCGSSLAAAASCTVSLTFKPSTTGARSANLTVTDNAAGSPQQVPLSGTGTTAELTPTSLSFGSVTVGNTSAAKTVTLKNVGTSAITITSITISGAAAGDFAQTNSCGSSLAASASCTISVTFKPTTTGTRGAMLKVTDSAAGSPQTVSLAGTGS
jgi:trimeric autotransporter adhesin